MRKAADVPTAVISETEPSYSLPLEGIVVVPQNKSKNELVLVTTETVVVVVELLLLWYSPETLDCVPCAELMIPYRYELERSM